MITYAWLTTYSLSSGTDAELSENIMSTSILQAARECTSLLSPSIWNLLFSFAIFLGILASFALLIIFAGLSTN
jgi:hypothetical protein